MASEAPLFEWLLEAMMVSGSDGDRRPSGRREGSEQGRDAGGRLPADPPKGPGERKGEGAAADPIDEESLDAVLRDCPL